MRCLTICYATCIPGQDLVTYLEISVFQFSINSDGSSYHSGLDTVDNLRIEGTTTRVALVGYKISELMGAHCVVTSKEAAASKE